jgi:hypothetical protein
MSRHDVGVHESSGSATFVFESLHILFVCRGMSGGENFECAETLQAGVASQIDDSHAAAAEQFLALVDAKAFAGFEGQFDVSGSRYGCMQIDGNDGVSVGGIVTVWHSQATPWAAGNVSVEMVVAGIAVENSHGESQ